MKNVIQKNIVSTGKVDIGYSSKVNTFLLKNETNDEEFEKWSKHVLFHYSSNDKITDYAAQYGVDYKKCVLDYILPNIHGGKVANNCARSEFSEILGQDIFEFIYGYEVPRYKLREKEAKDAPVKLIDFVSFKYENIDKTPSKKDVLCLCEAKSVFSKSDCKVLNGAIEDVKCKLKTNTVRNSKTLSFLIDKSERAGDFEMSVKLTRFTKKVDVEYVTFYCAFGFTAGNEVPTKEELDISCIIDDDIKLFYVYSDVFLDLMESFYYKNYE